MKVLKYFLYLKTFLRRIRRFVEAYKYKYNGKEWQDELGLNVTAMDFRQYDNAIGRFYGMDALAELSHNRSPYRFGFNNPVLFSDPSGLWEMKDGSWHTDDKKDIERFLSMLEYESYEGGASIGQIDKFIGEEFGGSGGRLSNGNILLDNETVSINKSGSSSGFSNRQISRINSQIENYGSHNWNDKSADFNAPWHTYKYFRERSYKGGFPGITLGAYASGQMSKMLYNNKSWYSLVQNKSYAHNFHGNQYTEKRVTIGNLSSFLDLTGKALTAYGMYQTYDQWNNGHLTNSGAAYLGGVDAAGLRGNPYFSAWSLGTSLGKNVVESGWYFESVHDAPNW